LDGKYFGRTKKSRNRGNNKKRFRNGSKGRGNLTKKSRAAENSVPGIAREKEREKTKKDSLTPEKLSVNRRKQLTKGCR